MLVNGDKGEDEENVINSMIRMQNCVLATD